MEYSDYLYVLSYTGPAGAYVYRLDIYTPEGAWLARTTGFNAAKLAVNYWRDLFALPGIDTAERGDPEQDRTFGESLDPIHAVRL